MTGRGRLLLSAMTVSTGRSAPVVRTLDETSGLRDGRKTSDCPTERHEGTISVHDYEIDGLLVMYDRWLHPYRSLRCS